MLGSGHRPRNAPPPGSRRVGDWNGMLVRSLVDLKNGSGSLPAGSLFTVESTTVGLTLRSQPCRCCGMRLYISRVLSRDVEPAGEAACATSDDFSSAELDQAAAQAMDRVGARNGHHALAVDPCITSNDELRRELVRSGVRLALGQHDEGGHDPEHQRAWSLSARLAACDVGNPEALAAIRALVEEARCLHPMMAPRPTPPAAVLPNRNAEISGLSSLDPEKQRRVREQYGLGGADGP